MKAISRVYIAIMAFTLVGMVGCGADEVEYMTETTTTTTEATYMQITNIDEVIIDTAAKDRKTTPTTSIIPVTTKNTTDTTVITTTEENKDTYKDNKFYEYIQSDMYYDNFGNRIVVDVVKGKQNCHVSANAYAKNEDKAIIDMASDEIDVVEGELNFFMYIFDHSDGAKYISKSSNTSEMENDPKKCIEIADVSMADDYCYVTLTQIDAPIDLYSKLKVLYLKDDRVVEAYQNYICLIANDLRGLGQKAVIELNTLDLDYNNIIVTIEP